MSTKRSLALLGATSLLLSILPAAAFAQDASAAPTAAPSETAKAVTVAKLAETKSPQEISALWAKASGQKADTVLIATAAKFPDSLASGTLQGKLGAPLLFVGDKVDDVTKAAIKNLGATKAVILGDEKAVSKSVEAELKELGITAPERLGGLARVETSIKIAERTGAKDDTIIIARQNDYADAIAAGALGAKTGYPVIVVPGETYKDSNDADVNLHPAVAKYLSDNNIKKVIVAGGEKAISKPVFDAIKAVVPSTERVKGDTRTGTALALADMWTDTKNITVVDGYETDNIGFYNGFAAALTAARNNAPILLSQNAVFSANALTKATATSGTGAYCGTLVDATVCEQVTKKLEAQQQTIKLDVKTPTDDKPSDKPVAGKLAITPTDRAVLVDTFLPGDHDDQREYKVTGLDDDTTYRIALFNGNRIKNVDGKITFLDNDEGDGKPVTGGRAIQGNVSSAVRIINGKTIPEGAGQSVAAKPENGVVNFTVDGNDFETVVPILFKDDNNDSQINLSADAVPTEEAAIGGLIQVYPLYAKGYEELGHRHENDNSNNIQYKKTINGVGDVPGAASVELVDRENNIAVVKTTSGAFRTIKFDNNDKLHLVYSGETKQVDTQKENPFWAEIKLAMQSDATATVSDSAKHAAGKIAASAGEKANNSENEGYVYLAADSTDNTTQIFVTNGDDPNKKLADITGTDYRLTRDARNKKDEIDRRSFFLETKATDNAGTNAAPVKVKLVDKDTPDERIVVVGTDGTDKLVGISADDVVAWRYPTKYLSSFINGTGADNERATEAQFKDVLSKGDKITTILGDGFQGRTEFSSDLTLINDSPGLPPLNANSAKAEGTKVEFNLQLPDLKTNKNPEGYEVEIRRTEPVDVKNYYSDLAKANNDKNPFRSEAFDPEKMIFKNGYKTLAAGRFADEDPKKPGIQFTLPGLNSNSYYGLVGRYIKNGEAGPWTSLSNMTHSVMTGIDRSDAKLVKVHKTAINNAANPTPQTQLILEFDRPVLPSDLFAGEGNTSGDGKFTVKDKDSSGKTTVGLEMLSVRPSGVAGNDKHPVQTADKLVLLKNLTDPVTPNPSVVEKPANGSKYILVEFGATDIPSSLTNNNGVESTDYTVSIAEDAFLVPSERVDNQYPRLGAQVIENAFKNR